MKARKAKHAKSPEARMIDRIVQRRERECCTLTEEALDAILARVVDLSPGMKVPARVTEAHAKIAWCLYQHLRISINKELATSTRHDSLRIGKKLLTLIDKAFANKENHRGRQHGAKTTAGATSGDRSLKPASNDGKNNRSTSGTAHNLVASRLEINKNQNGNGSATSTAGARQKPTSVSVDPVRGEGQIQNSTSSNKKKAGEESSKKDTAAGGNKNFLKNFCHKSGAYDGEMSKTAGQKSPSPHLPAAFPAERGQPPPYSKRSASFTAEPQTSNADNSKKARLASSNNKEPTKQGRAESTQPKEKTVKVTEQATHQAARIVGHDDAQASARAAAERAAADKKRIEESKRKAQLEKQLEEERKKVEEQRRQDEERRRAEILVEQKQEKEKKARLEAALELKKRKESVVSQMLRTSVVAMEQTVTFRDDPQPVEPNHSWAGAVVGRPQVSVRFRSHKLSRDGAVDLEMRLAKWEPNYAVEVPLSTGTTSLARFTDPSIKVKDTPTNKMVASATFTLGPEHLQGIKATDWGRSPPILDGQKRLILRMLPVKPPKKSADVHLWPKGTFVVVNGKPACRLEQRKQQRHDPEDWHALCKHLDLTALMDQPQPHRENRLKILTYDTQQFYFSIALCRYIAPASLYRSLVDKEQFLLERLSREDSIRKALEYTKHETLLLDDSDSDGESAQPVVKGVGKFVFTLTCPFSRTLLVTPVRGRKCKHFQCFDLINFLKSNSFVNGQRWRCLVCEDYVSWDDLQFCGLTKELTTEFKDSHVPNSRDRVEFSSDSTYKLLGARKLRYSNKKRSSTTNVNIANDTFKNQPVANAEPDVIELD